MWKLYHTTWTTRYNEKGIGIEIEKCILLTQLHPINYLHNCTLYIILPTFHHGRNNKRKLELRV